MAGRYPRGAARRGGRVRVVSLHMVGTLTIVACMASPLPAIVTPHDQLLARRLAVAGRLLRTAADAELARHGIAAAGVGVLLRLVDQDGLTQAQLARLQSVEAPTMCRLIDRLARDGMVERQADPQDRRATRVYLTAHGRETAASGAAVVADLEARAFADLEEDEARVLAALLDRVIERMAPGVRA
jgi:MarR family transcriptional regulator, transcriptional regulator for hemolysin